MNGIILNVLGVAVGVFFMCPLQLTAQKIHVTIDCIPKIHSSKQRIEFAGETNLPPGTVAWFRAGPKTTTPTIRLRTPSDQIPWGAGSVKFSVNKDGRFRGILKTSGKVKTGGYEFRVEIPLNDQPRDVIRVIGDRGENLAGPLVERGSSIFGSFCRVEFRSTTDFRKSETKKIERGEKRKYTTLLGEFKTGHKRLLALRRQGVFSDISNGIAPKWQAGFHRTATDVEFLLSGNAVDHLRKICFALDQMSAHALYPGKKDREFGGCRKELQCGNCRL